MELLDTVSTFCLNFEQSYVDSVLIFSLQTPELIIGHKTTDVNDIITRFANTIMADMFVVRTVVILIN